MTMKLISSVSVGAGGAATIDFSNIPSSYTDIIINISGRNTASYVSVVSVKFNNYEESTSYFMRQLYGQSNTAATNNQSIIRSEINPAAYSTNSFGSSEIYVMNYASSTAKTIIVQGAFSGAGSASKNQMASGRFTVTEPINRITLNAEGGNFAQYSSVSIYGVTKGIGGATTTTA